MNSTFTAKFAFDGGAYPWPLSEVPQEVLDFWSNIADAVDAPTARARLHHLLFEGQTGNRGTHGRTAAAAYLVLGTGSWPRLERVNCQYWSHELFQRVGDTEGAESVIPELIGIAGLSLGQAEPEAGVALHALEVLVSAAPQHSALPALLVQARAQYPDLFLAQHVIRLQQVVAKGDAGQQQQLQREAVETYLRHANGSQGLLRMKALEDAAQLATKYGLTDLVEQATTSMQQMSPEDLGFQTFEVTGSLPGAVVDGIVATVADRPSLAEALGAFVAAVPPTGDVRQNTAFIEQLATQAPLAVGLPTTQVGADGLPRYTSNTDAERHDEMLARIEVMRLGVGGAIVARQLLGILERFGPTVGELSSLLAIHGHVEVSVAESLAQSFLDFHVGRFDAAAAVATPKIETLIRARLSYQGNLQFRVQRGQNRGQYPQLGRMLLTAQSSLDPSWYRFLWTFLVSPHGPNYRNDLLHGFIDTVNKSDAALVLLAATYLALIPSSGSSEPVATAPTEIGTSTDG
jgi:hypothetical protein